MFECLLVSRDISTNSVGSFWCQIPLQSAHLFKVKDWFCDVAYINDFVPETLLGRRFLIMLNLLTSFEVSEPCMIVDYFVKGVWFTHLSNEQS